MPVPEPGIPPPEERGPPPIPLLAIDGPGIIPTLEPDIPPDIELGEPMGIEGLMLVLVGRDPLGIPGPPDIEEAPPIPVDGPPKFSAWTWSGRRMTRFTSTGMLEFAHCASNRGIRR
jgi:hypothetical protein